MKNPTIFKGTLLIFSCVLLTVLGLAILNSDLNADATTTIGLDINTGNITSSGTITSQDLTVQKAGDATLTVYSNTDDPTADSKLLVVQKGRTTPSELFSVDEDGDVAIANDLTVTGNVTSGTWQGTPIATKYGGTGQDWSDTAQGNLPYFSGTGTLSNLAPGTAGQFLKTGGTDADPAWANVTRSATFVVAASDSSTLSKQQADYVCDGTNDQVEIQKAIDALPSGGGKVLLMEGVYTTTGEIRLGSDVYLAGVGFNNTIIKFKDGTTPEYNIITIHGNNVKVSDIQLDCNKSNTSNPSTHNFGAGIEIPIGFHYIVIDAVYIHDSWRRLLMSYYSSDVKVLNSIFVNCVEDAVDIDHGCHRWIVSNNHISGTGEYGVTVDGGAEYATGHIISNNIIEDVATGIYAYGTASYNSNISNNIIRNVSTGIIAEYNNTVSNNNLFACSSFGIKAVHDNSIFGNTIIYMVDRRAIDISGDSNRVYGNTIVGGSQTIAVREACKYNVISVNHFTNVNSWNIQIWGDNNYVIGNTVTREQNSTTLSTNASSGATTINVSDQVFSIGDYVHIVLNDATNHDTYITAITDSALFGSYNQLTIRDALPSAADSGNSIAQYMAPVGIKIYAGASDNIISSNIIDDAGAFVVDDGTNTTIVGQM